MLSELEIHSKSGFIIGVCFVVLGGSIMVGTGLILILDQDAEQFEVNFRISIIISGFIFAGSGSASILHSLDIII